MSTTSRPLTVEQAAALIESRRVGLMSSPAYRDRGSVFAGQCKARLGSAVQGVARQGSRNGTARYAKAWRGRAGSGAVRRGSRLAWHGTAGPGIARPGSARHGMDRQGSSLGLAGRGMAWRCKDQVPALRGTARLGVAWRGSAMQGAGCDAKDAHIFNAV